MKTRKGFTLIELLVVIVIIGILATYLIPTIMGAPARARDAGRQSVLNGIKVALTSYYSDYGHFPVGEACISSGDTAYVNDDDDSDFTIETLRKYFEGNKLPDDPQSVAKVPAGSDDCNGYYYKSIRAVDGGRESAAYIVASVAEIQGNATQDCETIDDIDSLDSDSLVEPDADATDAHWCMIVTGS